MLVSVTLPLSLPEVILASRFSTRLSLLNPSPSLGISSSPFRPISPRAVTAAIVSKGAPLSKKDPVEGTEKFTSRLQALRLIYTFVFVIFAFTAYAYMFSCVQVISPKGRTHNTASGLANHSFGSGPKSIMQKRSALIK